MAFLNTKDQVLYISTVNTSHTLANTSKLRITNGFSLTASSISQSISKSRVTTTPNRVKNEHVVGTSPVKVSFETYMKPYDTGSVITSAEKLLWESFAGAPSTEAGSVHTIDFLNSNISKLIELYIYVELDNANFIIEQAVVETVQIDLSISDIPKIKWTVLALRYTEVSALPSTYTDYTSNTNFLLGKLSTLTGVGGYTLVLTGGSITLKNEVLILARKRIGVDTNPEGHYVRHRRISGNFTCYVKSGASESLDFLNTFAYNSGTQYFKVSGISGIYTCGVDTIVNSVGTSFNIVTDNTLDKDGTSYNAKEYSNGNNVSRPLTFNISGTTNPYVEFSVPYAKITLPKLNFKDVVTTDFSFAATESVVGAGDEVTIKYYT